MKTVFTKSELMSKAWTNARNAAKSFGGKASEYFSNSLANVWADLRNDYTASFEKVSQRVTTDGFIMRIREKFSRQTLRTYYTVSVLNAKNDILNVWSSVYTAERLDSPYSLRDVLELGSDDLLSRTTGVINHQYLSSFRLVK